MTLQWFLCGVVVAFYGLIMTAVTSKYLEVKRARLWLPATARIVASRTEARRVTRPSSRPGTATQTTEIRNFAAVRYAFNVNGRRVDGTRIGIAADPGNVQIAEKLRRYPVGASVTAYYDPNRPQDCVLERDIPERLFRIAFLGGGLIGIVGLVAIVALSGGYDVLVSLGSAPRQLSSVGFVTVMTLLSLWFAYAFHQQGAATKKWLPAQGEIVSSAVETVKVRVSQDVMFNNILATAFLSRTTYAYQVDGVRYHGDRVGFGFQTLATFRLLARHEAARFVPGQTVEVFYNPAAPEQAVLVRGTQGEIIIYLTAAALIAIALRLSGMI